MIKARQGKARQGKARQGKARQGKARLSFVVLVFWFSVFSILFNPLIPSVILANDGDRDTTFGNGGMVKTFWNNYNKDQIWSVAIQSDGKIVAAGYTVKDSSLHPEFAVARYNINGTLDDTFGTNGKVTTAIGGGGKDEVYSVAIQSDGKIVAAGLSSNGTNWDFAVVRYNTNGTIDTTFNGTGKVTTAIGGDDDVATSVTMQSDGKIVVAGCYKNGANWDFAVVRYDTNGALDNTFGTNGKVTTAVGDDGAVLRRVIKAAMQSDGKIVAAGWTTSGANQDFAVVRYKTDGTLDNTFGTNGKVTTAIGVGDEYINAVAIQSDGKIVAAGVNLDFPHSFAIARYNTDGTLDTTFNNTGKVIDHLNDWDYIFAVAIQSDGKIVAAGNSYIGGSNVVGIMARYLSTAGYTLTLTKTGAGTITASPSGINCGATCTAVYAKQSTVTLTAVPASGGTTSWSGCTSSSGNTCTVSMTSDKTITATFASTLTVTKTGTGSVTSTPYGINCGATCTSTFTGGSTVTLTATPGAGYTTSWTGCTTSSGNTCTITMSSNTTVTAAFTAIPVAQYTLSVTKTGLGSVTISPSDTECGSACTVTYSANSTVTLTATPGVAGVSIITKFTGCTVNANTCTLTMSSDKTVTVEFINAKQGPNGTDTAYDGNHDGVADVTQGNVTSFFSGSSTDATTYVTMAVTSSSSSTATLSTAGTTTTQNASGLNLTIGASGKLPLGTIVFQLASVQPSVENVVKFYLPSNANVSKVVKYGATPDNTTAHWYDFTCAKNNPVKPCGEITTENGRKVAILYLIDGQKGDDDLLVNTVIKDDVAFASTPVTCMMPLLSTGGVTTWCSVTNGSTNDSTMTFTVLGYHGNNTATVPDAVNLSVAESPRKGETVVYYFKGRSVYKGFNAKDNNENTVVFERSLINLPVAGFYAAKLDISSDSATTSNTTMACYQLDPTGSKRPLPVTCN